MGVLQNFLFGSIAIWTPVVPVAYSFWPKYSGGPDSIEVEIEQVNLDSRSNSVDLKPWIRVIKQRDCWSLAEDNESSKEFRELIVCRDKENSSKPNVYFYKLDKQERIISVSMPDKTMQKAEKVINLSFEHGKELDNHLEIDLVRNQKEKMKLSSVVSWANVRKLNPYRECRLLETSGKNPAMVCMGQRDRWHFFKSFVLT